MLIVVLIAHIFRGSITRRGNLYIANINKYFNAVVQRDYRSSEYRVEYCVTDWRKVNTSSVSAAKYVCS